MTTTEKVQQHLKTCDMRRTRQRDTARALCISETTLRRHLRFEGTNYQALLEAEKRRRVLDLLERNPHVDTWRVADALGYSERNTAARTFSRLFGVGIREFKRAKA